MKKTALSRISHQASSEQAFTLVELMIVILIIGIMLGATVIATWSATNSTDVNSAAEILKQDLRRVYTMASNGERPVGIDYRFRYRITFNGNSDTPPNSYLIERGTPDPGGTYGWLPMTPQKAATNKRGTGSYSNYIIPATTSGTQLDYGTNRTIYFVSVGSMSVANTTGDGSPGGNMTITFRNGAKTKNVNISGYGSISD